MKCSVFRSSLRDFTYLYLPSEAAYESVPVELQALFGTPVKVLDLELSSERPLAQEDVHVVMENLRRQGYHLQLPPQEDPDGWLELPKS